MNPTSIPWADQVWNPVTGCTFGCSWCYARPTALMRQKNPNPKVARAYRNGFAPTCHPDRLDEPLRRKKPATIFVCSMGDLFDPAVPDEFVADVFGMMRLCSRHTFVILTKRADRMRRWFEVIGNTGFVRDSRETPPELHAVERCGPWPLPNLWLGVSVTNQADADERIPLLLDTPAAHRMVSVEPMLGPVNLQGALGWDYINPETGECHGVPSVDFVAIGAKTPGPALHEQLCSEVAPSCVEDYCAGENGCPNAWLRDLIAQCILAGVPLHYKHGGANPPVNGFVYDWRPGA